MKDFADKLVDFIIAKETPRLNKIMKEVTDKIRDDFAAETMILLDAYYDDYTPLYYVRIDKNKRKTPRKNPNGKPRKGSASLYSAVEKALQTSDKVAISGGSFETGYIGGVAFNPDYFARYNMKHFGKGDGFKDWNILENFLFAGEGASDNGALVGDWRSAPGYDGPDAPSFDSVMQTYMYGIVPSKIDRYYKNALKNNK